MKNESLRVVDENNGEMRFYWDKTGKRRKYNSELSRQFVALRQHLTKQEEIIDKLSTLCDDFKDDKAFHERLENFRKMDENDRDTGEQEYFLSDFSNSMKRLERLTLKTIMIYEQLDILI